MAADRHSVGLGRRSTLDQCQKVVYISAAGTGSNHSSGGHCACRPSKFTGAGSGTQ